MADFPYFKNTTAAFPGIDDLSPQDYANAFDYEVYDRPATLHLLNVPWHDDGKDVVRFADEAARDAWMSAAGPERREYSTAWLRIPEQTITVDLPYEAAARHNYLFVDVPQLPVDRSDAPTRLFYFVTGIRYAAPSATVLDLRLDTWQTYGYRMDVSTVDLVRGHAPMYRSSVDAFLSDPLDNNAYLLAPDVSFDDKKDVAAKVKHYPMASGMKWLVLALPVSSVYIDDIGAGSSVTPTGPTYGDTGERNGYQDAVSGYVWGWAGESYPDAYLPNTTGATSDQRTLDGCYLYATPFMMYGNAGNEYNYAKVALAALAARAPHLLASAKYAAIVPNAIIDPVSNTRINICGYNWIRIEANPHVVLDDFALTKDNIGLPDYAADIAKLYTSQYTVLEVSDQEGHAFDVAIEDIKGPALRFNLDISLAAASLICDIECVNVGTDDSYTLKWRDLNAGEVDTTLYGADIAEYCLHWGIPTYALDINAGSLEAARSWSELEAKRQAALNAYHASVRHANTSRANTVASNATSVSNTARTNTANVANARTDARGNTLMAGYQNNYTNSLASRSNTFTDDMNGIQMNLMKNLLDVDNSHQNYVQSILNSTLSINAYENMVGNLGAGNVLGAIQSGIGAAVAYTNDNDLTNEMNSWRTKKTNWQRWALGRYSGDTPHTNQNDVQQSYQTDRAAYEVTLNNYLNAVVNYVQEDDGTDGTMMIKAKRNADASNDNAEATQATSDANARYSNNDSILAAKAALELAQQEAAAALRKASTSLVPAGSTAGDNSMDAFNRRSFRVRTKTQNGYALRAAAKHFTRYGYAYGAPLDFSDWLEGGHYCHWQADDAIIKGDVPDMYVRDVKRLLQDGMTVWDAPERIGDYE